MFTRFVMVATLALCALALSCIEADESIVISANGSGEINCYYEVPAQVLAAQQVAEIESALAASGGDSEIVQLAGFSSEVVDGMRSIKFKLVCDDLQKLNGWNAAGEAQSSSSELSESEFLVRSLVGEIQVEREGLDLIYHREVDLWPWLEQTAGAQAWLLSGAQLKFSMQLPMAVSESDAHHLSADGRHLQWVFTLGQYQNKPMQMSLRAPIVEKRNLLLATSAGVVVLLMLSVLVKKWRRRSA